MNRVFTEIAKAEAKVELNNLLTNSTIPERYRKSMIALGKMLAEEISPSLKSKKHSDALIISTAEDADFLQEGVSSILQENGIDVRLAVFWNHHYQMSNQSSVAPILHQFIQPKFEKMHNIVIVKSIISGSCVVRTNLIEMLDKIDNIEDIFILSPVAHKDSEKKLKSEFPEEISKKFKFFCFAIDDKKTCSGEVEPGIGGQIYELLGLGSQPVLTGYMPEVVSRLCFQNV